MVINRFISFRFSPFIALLVMATCLLYADRALGASAYWVSIKKSSTHILFTSLPGYYSSPPPTVTVARSVAHGSLVQNAEHFTYTPEEDFWVLGSDSFVYTLEAADGSTETLSFILVAGLPTLGSEAHSWEPPCPNIGTNDGTSIDVAMDVPEPVGQPFPPPVDFDVVILTATPVGESTPTIQVWLRSDGGQLFLWGEVWDGATSQPITTLPRAINDLAHHLAIVWWPADEATEQEGGFFLWVDDFLVGVVRSNHVFDSVCGFNFDFPEPVESPFDLVALGGGEESVFDAARVESFEDGMSSWQWVPPSSGIAGNLAVLEKAAISGEWGLASDLEAAQGQTEYLVDSSPSASARYGARLSFDTRDLDLFPCDAILIFAASDQDIVTEPSQHVRLLLRRACDGTDSYQLKARARHQTSPSSTEWWGSAWYTVDDGVHTVELDWRTASGPSEHDGYLRLWLDGIYTANVAYLGNGNRRIEAVLLATVGVDVNSGGFLYLDDFESWSSSGEGE